MALQMLQSCGARSRRWPWLRRRVQHPARRAAASRSMGTWGGIFQRKGQISSFKSRPGKPSSALFRARAAGAWLSGIVAGLKQGLEHGVRPGAPLQPLTHLPQSPPLGAPSSLSLANACSGTARRSAAEPKPVLQGTRLCLPGGGSQARSSPPFSQDLRFWWLNAEFSHLCSKAGLVWRRWAKKGEVKGRLGQFSGFIWGLWGCECNDCINRLWLKNERRLLYRVQPPLPLSTSDPQVL